MSPDRTLGAEQDVGRINAFFPILPLLGNQWAAARPWEGRTVALNLHLTTITAAFLRELSLGGGRFVVSAANPHTTDLGAVSVVRGLGFEVYPSGEDRHAQVLEHRPSLLVDVGAKLFDTLLDKRRDVLSGVEAGIEITRSGVDRLRARASLPIPVVNINDGRLKDKIENRHGVGEALWQAVAVATGMHLAGRRVLIMGYGPVGRGVAHYARAAGMSVEVCEIDAVRRLYAHYDGYPTPDLAEGLARAAVVVTATGRKNTLPVEALANARDGVVLVNAGHAGDEIDVDGIRRTAVASEHVAEQVARYPMPSGRTVTLLGDGHPFNIVQNAGSPEPVLLHFAVVGLTLAWLAGRPKLTNGEVALSPAIENKAAELALAALTSAGA
jgi:adenosylhomocysteinase